MITCLSLDKACLLTIPLRNRYGIRAESYSAFIFPKQIFFANPINLGFVKAGL